MADSIAFVYRKLVNWEDRTPFSKEISDKALELFSEVAEKHLIKVFICHFDWIEKDVIRKAWCFEDSKWKRVFNVKVDLLYQKFGFREETRKIKEMLAKHFNVVNSLEMEEVCRDKFATHKMFSNYMKPCFLVKNSDDIKNALEGIRSDSVVLKPRYGFAGRDVKVVPADIALLAQLLGGSKEDMLLEEFIDSSKGVECLGISGVHDLRVVVVNSVIAVSYVRLPKSGLVSNVAKGGELRVLDVEKLPKSVVWVVAGVDLKLKKFGLNAYTVDFLFDAGQQPWIIELNSQPDFEFRRDDEKKMETEHFGVMCAQFKSYQFQNRQGTKEEAKKNR